MTMIDVNKETMSKTDVSWISTYYKGIYNPNDPLNSIPHKNIRMILLISKSVKPSLWAGVYKRSHETKRKIIVKKYITLIRTLPR